MLDFYNLLPKYVSKGRTNLLDGAEEVVPLALMALRHGRQHRHAERLRQGDDFLMSIRTGVTTISVVDYIDDAIAGKIILGQGWNGDVRRIVQGRKKQGDITAVLPHEKSEIWSDNWCIPKTAPHPVAAHAWINWLLTPSTAVTEMEYHNYPIPIPSALSQLPVGPEQGPALQRPDQLHRQLPVHPQREPAGGAGPDQDLHAVQGRLMALDLEQTEETAAQGGRRRRRSFSPRYPGWLTSPSLLYYAIFFLGPLAILVAFSLATQTGFDSITYGFDTSQYHLVLDPLYLKIFYRTLIMAATGSLLTILVGYPDRVLDGALPHRRTRCWRCC